MRKLLVDPPTAEIVRRIFDLAAQGFASGQIANIINDEEPRVPTPQERKIQLREKRRWKKGDAMFWYASMISLIIKDERYTGKLIYGKKKTVKVSSQEQIAVPQNEWIVIPDAIPAIITEEQYRAANKNSTKRNNPEIKQARTELLFSGKLKCGFCGLALRAAHRKQGVRYKCNTPKYSGSQGCSLDWVAEKDIATVVLASLQKRIAFVDEAREMLESKNEQLLPKIEKLNSEILKLQELIAHTKEIKLDLWEKFCESKLSIEDFQYQNEKADERASKYAAKINSLQARIRELKADIGCDNLFVERFGKWKDLQGLTREVVEEFISEVYGVDRIKVAFKIDEEYEELITLLGHSKRKQMTVLPQ